MTNRTMSTSGTCRPADVCPSAVPEPYGENQPRTGMMSRDRMYRMENNGGGSGGDGGCSLCGRLDGYPLAMAYVPMQRFENLYSPETALCAGTVFADLDKPFCGKAVSDSAYPRRPAKTCGAGNSSCGCGTAGAGMSERGGYR